MRVSFQLNGKPASISTEDPQMPLLYALRNDLALRGPRFGCGLGQCGACTVHLEGAAVRSCVIPVSSVAGRHVVTIECLGTPTKPHPLQGAFITEQVIQWGRCIKRSLHRVAVLVVS